MLEHCKWDPQVEDTPTIAPFPLLLRRSAWNTIRADAESLAAETVTAEQEILRRPKLLEHLGLPRAIRRVLRRAGELGQTASAGRVMRFDFHWTRQGWRVSEVNADVPGGYTESSSLTAMMREHFSSCESAGDPAQRWVDTLAETAGPGGAVVLLSAPGYMEDSQIVAFLARKLHASGCVVHLADPTLVSWNGGHATLNAAWGRIDADVVLRFYQAEWLSRLPERTGWPYYFCGGRTPVANPGIALLGESKRFPLLWDRLQVRMPTWKRLLPETRSPRQARWFRDDDWILKSAISNNGDSVAMRGVTPAAQWRRAAWSATLFHDEWLAQRRFETIAMPTPVGPMFPCLGVYTVNGKAAGIYGRLSRTQVVDFTAIDAAVLIADDQCEGGAHC